MATTGNTSRPESPNTLQRDLPDKVPIILRDGETGETHYIFARRPEVNQPAFNVSISFHTKDGTLHKHRIPIHHHSNVHDVTINGRFMIFNDTSKYKDPSEVGKLLMHKALQEQVADTGKTRKTKNFQNKPSRLSQQGTTTTGGKRIKKNRLLSVAELANGKIKLSTRKIT